MLTLKISPDGAAPYVVKAEARDVLVWERTGKNRSLGTLFDNVRVDDWYSLAYITARRLGLYEGNAATFEATCNVDLEADEDAAQDPTSPAP